jgi:hypothetical protein
LREIGHTVNPEQGGLYEGPSSVCHCDFSRNSAAVFNVVLNTGLYVHTCVFVDIVQYIVEQVYWSPVNLHLILEVPVSDIEVGVTYSEF